ncbi:MAG: SEC-C domain-containing protein [Rhodospirillaceae bacterium]|nr:SEC-C domain-containing protein [Rhodospirillaceae bacterium]
MSTCICGTGKDFQDCCGPLIDGAAAATAEALLRSRYTAFAMGRTDYLVETLTPDLRDGFDLVEAESTAADARWQGLEVRSVTGGGPDDVTGEIEFVASFRLRDEPRVHHELSQFRREDGRWLCAGGQTNPKGAPRDVVKVGRNEPCPCGSGKKFKKCCGA